MHRLTPVTNTCVANAPETKSLAQRVLKLFLAQNPDSDYRVRHSWSFGSRNSRPPLFFIFET
jgi:hypothetical protein